MNKKTGLENFIAYLMSQTALTDLIGTRLYPNEAAQRVPYPWIVYTRRTVSEISSMNGGNGLWRMEIEFEIVSDSFEELCDINVVLDDLLDHTAPGVHLQTNFQACFPALDTRDTRVQQKDGSEKGRSRISVIYTVLFSDAN